MLVFGAKLVRFGTSSMYARRTTVELYVVGGQLRVGVDERVEVFAHFLLMHIVRFHPDHGR